MVHCKSTSFSSSTDAEERPSKDPSFQTSLTSHVTTKQQRLEKNNRDTPTKDPSNVTFRKHIKSTSLPTYAEDRPSKDPSFQTSLMSLVTVKQQRPEQNSRDIPPEDPLKVDYRNHTQLTSLPTEILFLIIFCIDDTKDLRSLASTNRWFRALWPHTITTKLWFAQKSRGIPPERLLSVANELCIPLEFEYAKRLITENAPDEPPGLNTEPPGPKRALRRKERVMHIVERFSLFLHNMLAINYYHFHDWDALKRVADEFEQYLDDFGWVQFYRDNEIESTVESTLQLDQEFESIAFEGFAKKLKSVITIVSSVTTSNSSSKHNCIGSNQNNSLTANNYNDKGSNRHNELFSSLAPESVYLRWTNLIRDQLDFIGLQRYVLDKFKTPATWQFAEYLSVVINLI